MFGQCGHFLGYAPRKIQYAIDRYRNETLRLYGVMDRRLKSVEYLAGKYSIADMATWPWVRVRWLHRIDLAEFPHVQRWYEAIGARPAVQRALEVLAKREKIGNPDAKAREALFGRSQLTQSRRPRRVAAPASAGHPKGRRADKTTRRGPR
jgi:GST-like protein